MEINILTLSKPLKTQIFIFLCQSNCAISPLFRIEKKIKEKKKKTWKNYNLQCKEGDLHPRKST